MDIECSGEVPLHVFKAALTQVVEELAADAPADDADVVTLLATTHTVAHRGQGSDGGGLGSYLVSVSANAEGEVIGATVIAVWTGVILPRLRKVLGSRRAVSDPVHVAVRSDDRNQETVRTHIDLRIRRSEITRVELTHVEITHTHEVVVRLEDTEADERGQAR